MATLDARVARLEGAGRVPLAALSAAAHPRCVVCSPANPGGLGLECTVMPDDSVEGKFTLAELVNPDDGKHLAIYHLDGEKVQ